MHLKIRDPLKAMCTQCLKNYLELETVEAIEAIEVDVIDLDVVEADKEEVIIFDSSIAFTFSMTLVTSFEAEVEADNELDLKAEDSDNALRIGRLPKAVNDLDPVNEGCREVLEVGSTVAVSTFSSIKVIRLEIISQIKLIVLGLKTLFIDSLLSMEIDDAYMI